MATIRGTTGPDIRVGGAEPDRFDGLGGADVFDGQAGDDVINGGQGNDALVGGAGIDRILGGLENDLILGGEGDDDLGGGGGEEGQLETQAPDGDDSLLGGPGDDELDGFSGDDALQGGPGADVFWFWAGEGNDVILDFTSGEDQIALREFQISSFGGLDTNGNGVLDDADLDVAVVDGSTVVDFAGLGSGTSLFVLGVVDALTANDFSFGDGVVFV